MRPMLRMLLPSASSSLACILAIVGLGTGYVVFGFGWALVTMVLGGVMGKLIEYRLQADRLASGDGPARPNSAF